MSAIVKVKVVLTADLKTAIKLKIIRDMVETSEYETLWDVEGEILMEDGSGFNIETKKGLILEDINTIEESYYMQWVVASNNLHVFSKDRQKVLSFNLGDYQVPYEKLDLKFRFVDLKCQYLVTELDRERRERQKFERRLWKTEEKHKNEILELYSKLQIIDNKFENHRSERTAEAQEIKRKETKIIEPAPIALNAAPISKDLPSNPTTIVASSRKQSRSLENVPPPIGHTSPISQRGNANKPNFLPIANLEAEVIETNVPVVPKTGGSPTRGEGAKTVKDDAERLRNSAPASTPTYPKASVRFLTNEFWKALESREVERMRELIKAGADIISEKEGSDSGLYTPLTRCCAIGFIEGTKLLIEEGHVDVNQVESTNNTGLHRACRGRNNTEMVKYLIDKKADVNAQDWYGWTPLHAAAIKDRHEVVQLLLNARADPSIENNDEKTAHAVATGRTKEIFSSHSEDDKKKNPLDFLFRINTNLMRNYQK